MSGGSMDYLYCKIEDASFREYTPERRAFKTLLNKIGKACHKIEWNDSGDGADGEIEAIKECLGDNADALIIAEAVDEAQTAIDTLTRLIGQVSTGQENMK